MNPTRRSRIESVIRDEISRMLLRSIKDPRIPTLTLTQLELAHDASHCLISFTIFGNILKNNETDEEIEDDERQVEDCLAGLNSAIPFFRKQLAKVLELRQVPTLKFKYDRGLENTIRVNEILENLKKSP